MLPWDVLTRVHTVMCWDLEFNSGGTHDLLRTWQLVSRSLRSRTAVSGKCRDMPTWAMTFVRALKTGSRLSPWPGWILWGKTCWWLFLERLAEGRPFSDYASLHSKSPYEDAGSGLPQYLVTPRNRDMHNLFRAALLPIEWGSGRVRSWLLRALM